MHSFFGHHSYGNPSSTYIGEQDPLLPSVSFSGYLPKVAEVEFIDLFPGKTFYKKQYRKDNKTRQLVKKGHGYVRMVAKTNCQLLRVLGWVKREDKAAHDFKDRNGEVPICGKDNQALNLIRDTDMPTSTDDGFTLQPFSVDLHDVYDGPFQPVFQLFKSDMDKSINVFQLVIQLEFLDGSTTEKFYSPTFNLCTEHSQSSSQGAKKRKHPDVENGRDSFDNSPGPSSDSGLSDVRHQQILVDVLDAKTADIETLVAQNLRVETKQADLAYHLRLKDPGRYQDLNEGDIVGFYKDEESGDTYIQPLRSGNIHSALHAGVVSRSHWLAGHKPQNPAVKTDTICVIGIVNVKVIGSIENGERIYASRHHPGKAIPQSHMPVGSFLRKKHVLLGMALETKKSPKILDKPHLVKCFVCIVLDVSRQELLQEIEDLYEVNERRTEEQIKLASKKTWRRLKGCFLVSMLLLALIIFVLYQWLVPGSMFRYWLCRRGSIPDHDLYFTYVDQIIHRRFKVHGIQFTFEKLRSKVGVRFKQNEQGNGSLAFYYLNIDRCAYYWADGAAGNNIGGRKYVGGERILSVVKDCKVVYGMFEQEDRWEKVGNQSKVTCKPLPAW